MTIERAILLVNLALIAIGAYFVAGLFYQVAGSQFRSADSERPAQTVSPTVKASGRKSFAAYRPILQRDLFKTQKSPVKQPVQESKVDLENIEETKLKLKLWGTVTGEERQSYAVIEDTQKREQNLYRVGDSVQNATLKMILRSKVILSLNGKDEVLGMEELTQKSRARSRPARASASPASTPGAVRTQRVSLRRNMIENAIQDVSKLMTEIQIRPHMEDGVAAGLALSNIKPNSIFRRMGLRNGDVLKSVDGSEIQTVDDALKLYENLKTASEVSVRIQRRGRERNISYNIR